MKASKVIERLQKLMHEHGDKNLMFHGPDHDDMDVGAIAAYDKQGKFAKEGNCDHFYIHVYED